MMTRQIKRIVTKDYHLAAEKQVHSPLNDHQKCRDLVVTHWRWLLMTIQPPGVSSEKSSQHVYSLAENSLYAISKLCLPVCYGSK